VGSPDDFASMYEVLSRRFRRAREASIEAQSRGELDESSWKLPDLIVVDGGKGQLGMALAAARDVGIDVRPGVGLPIVALAKERDMDPGGLAAEEPAPAADLPPPAESPSSVDLPPPDAPIAESSAPAGPPVVEPPVPPPPGPRRRGRKQGAEPAGRRPDRVFLAQAKDAIPIRPNSAEMFVLAHLRDEAHRFAVTFHRNQRKRRTLRSVLSDIAGIGVARQRELLRHFGSVRKIREATVDDLAAVPGVSRKTAEAVRAYFEAHGDFTPPAEAAAPAGTPLEGPAAPATTGEEAEEDALESAFAEVEEAP
jgi:excinuclease ABC subunit C